MDTPNPPTLLLTGATGFIGGQFLSELAGTEPIRCLVRDAGKLEGRAGVEAAEADVMERETLSPVLDGIDLAYYLIHSMEPGGGAGFADKDRKAAENFGAAAAEAGVRRIVYLGGVSSTEGDSEHLESRTEVEEILRNAVPETVALHASMIVGPGSESFRTMVQLVDRMPVLFLPSWRDSRSQPVGIDDVVSALLAAREVEPGSYDIAGPDTLTFERMTEIVGDLLGDRKPSMGVPLSVSKAESVAVAAVVDADRELLEPLLEGLHGDLIVSDNALVSKFGIEPTPFCEAAEAAIAGMDN